MTPRLLVDLDAFRHNLAVVRRVVSPVPLMLVVKDDAYGHGLDAIVGAAVAAGVREFVAFSAATGVRAHDLAGDGATVLALLVSAPDEIREALATGLDIGAGSRTVLEDIAVEASRLGVAPRIHVKADTGLHRNGIPAEEWPDAVRRARELEAAGTLRVEGIWSHIAEASDAEDDAARAAFEAAIERAVTAGLTPAVRHLAASAAAFARPEFRYDRVRIGAFCYGIRPAGGPHDDELGIRPVASLRASVVGLRGSVARVGVGSAHGLASSLAGLATVVAGGSRRRLLRVDAFESEIEGWPGAAPGDEVVVFGAHGAPSATDLAELIGTIGEEIVLRVNPLVPREYVGG